MKTLNFYPQHEAELLRQDKTKTIRLGDKTDKYQVGDIVMLTVGWKTSDFRGEKPNKELCKVKITECRKCKLEDLTSVSMRGETLALSKYILPYFLSVIYAKVIEPSDIITIIAWEYV